MAKKATKAAAPPDGRGDTRRTVDFGDALLGDLEAAFDTRGFVSFSEGLRAACRYWMDHQPETTRRVAPE
jgi:hypothetical protein